MTLDRLKWLAVLAPFLVLIGVELVRQTTSLTLFTGWTGFLVLAAGLLLASMLFAEVIFGGVNRLQASLAQRNQELLVLHDASLAIVGEHNLETVLQLVVDRARDLVGARYGALSLVRDEGGIEAFLTAGISDDERAVLGPPPVGHGILGVVLNDGATLRLDDLTRDPRSVGFPANHPPMKSFLGVPISRKGERLGNLYLTDKRDGDEFSGLIASEDAQVVTLRLGAEITRKIEKRNITARETLKTSGMPDGLAATLSAQEFVDVIEFLAAQK